jgi:imidazolonepropionase-like amidohydrolase
MRARGWLIATLALGCATLGSPKPAPQPDASPAPERAANESREPSGPFLLLRGASLLTANGPILEKTDLLVRGDRIQAIGRNLETPPGAAVLDVEGRWITPGLIDPHSHMGVYANPSVNANADGNEVSSPFTPEVRAEEAFWPQDPALRTARAGGVTTIHVLPGSANLVGGQGVTLRLLPRVTAREMRFPGAPTTMKMACGENPKRIYGQEKRTAPTTRMGEVALLRQKLEEARAYKTESDKPADFGKLALQRVVRGEILIENHCYRADEMAVRLDLFREFDLKPRAFHHAVEAYKIRAQLAAEGVAAVIWADWWGRKLEMLDAVPANAALLDAAGVRVALHSDSPYEVQRLNQQAARAIAAGRRAGIDIPRERAIRWITANPAWVLGIESRTGTLEPGKDADLTVWSGDPFSVYTRADLVFIAGERVYDRSEPAFSRPTDFELGLDTTGPAPAPRGNPR